MDLKNLETALYKAHPSQLPIAFSSEELLFPPKLRELFDWVMQKARDKEIIRAIIKAPRGGGKTRLLASLELALWLLEDFDVVNLGGSFVQASKVYGYLSEAFNSELIKPQIKKSIRTETVKKKEYGRGKIVVVAATEKQTRSPHPGGRKRGGLLSIDEECEAEESIVKSAIPSVDTANPSAIIRSSTFHKAFGTYQDCWDNAKKYGYTRFEWDIFDVSEKCRDDCQKVKDPITEAIGPCNVLKYCQGKAHQSEGWVRIDEIRQARREMSEDQFLIEMMGSRPGSAGLVYPPILIDAATVSESFKLIPNASCAIGVDWGYDETFITLIQEQHNQEKKKFVRRIIDAQAYHHAKEEEIYYHLQVLSNEWEIPLYLDASHIFQNQALEMKGASVVPIHFAKLKDYGINNIKKMMEDSLLEIPAEFDYLIDKLKNYRRNKSTGKPIKKDDHAPDSLLCACFHFSDQGIGYDPEVKRFEVVDPFKHRRRIY